jgi:FMN-dependent dehydrogenase
VSVGVDGIMVSNHGERHIDALPAAIDALPAVTRRVGGRTTVMMASGVRRGGDLLVVRDSGALQFLIPRTLDRRKCFRLLTCALAVAMPDDRADLLQRRECGYRPSFANTLFQVVQNVGPRRDHCFMHSCFGVCHKRTYVLLTRCPEKPREAHRN